MNPIHSPAEISVLQAAQAQKAATRQRDREKAAAEAGRRWRDLVDLRVAGVEETEAVRRLPENDSEQAESEHRAEAHGPAQRRASTADDNGDADRPHVDVVG